MTCCLGEPWSLIQGFSWICFIIKFLNSARPHSSWNIQHIHCIPGCHKCQIRIHLHHLRDVLSCFNFTHRHETRPVHSDRVTYHLRCHGLSFRSDNSRLLHFFISHHHEFLSRELRKSVTSQPAAGRFACPRRLSRTTDYI